LTFAISHALASIGQYPQIELWSLLDGDQLPKPLAGWEMAKPID
jgi:hypothetical protein